jgi:plasmid stabilization system protein ParE
VARRIKLVWSTKAKEDLKHIHDYIAANDRRAAKKHIVKLKQWVRLLPEQPEMGRKVPELDQPDIRERIFGANYRIVYRRQPTRIEILAVWHAAQSDMLGF